MNVYKIQKYIKLENLKKFIFSIPCDYSSIFKYQPTHARAHTHTHTHARTHANCHRFTTIHSNNTLHSYTFCTSLVHHQAVHKSMQKTIMFGLTVHTEELLVIFNAVNCCTVDSSTVNTPESSDRLSRNVGIQLPLNVA
jgi:hypothetical protein